MLLGVSEKRKKEYPGRLIEAPLLASFCLTEPGAGSDVSGMRTIAMRKGDKWVINGSKVFITNGGHANWYTVYTKTGKEAGHGGISCFIVPRDAGVIVDKHEEKMDLWASNPAAISFEEYEIPADYLLAEETTAVVTLDRTRPGVAALPTAIARAALEFAIDYSKERNQLAIQLMTADMATGVEAARLVTWRSGVLLCQDKRNTLASSHAKPFAADTAMKIATAAVQVHGGYGFIKEYRGREADA